MRKTIAAWGIAATAFVNPVQAADDQQVYSRSTLARELDVMTPSVMYRCMSAALNDVRGLADVANMNCMRLGSALEINFGKEQAKCSINHKKKNPEDQSLGIVVMQSGKVLASVQGPTIESMQASVEANNEFHVASGKVLPSEQVRLAALMRNVRASCP